MADEVGDEIILGRDVLNKLPIFLDGVLQQMDVLDEAVAQRLRPKRPSAK